MPPAELRGNSSTSKHDPHRIGEAPSLPLNQPVKESSRQGVGRGFKESCTADITNGSHSTQESVALNRLDCVEPCSGLLGSYDNYPDSLEEEVIPNINFQITVLHGGRSRHEHKTGLLAVLPITSNQRTTLSQGSIAETTEDSGWLMSYVRFSVNPPAILTETPGTPPTYNILIGIVTYSKIEKSNPEILNLKHSWPFKGSSASSACST